MQPPMDQPSTPKRRVGGKRVGFHKSRTGCLRCKQRKVKCDEKIPCAACLRHEVSCSLENAHSQREGTSCSSQSDSIETNLQAQSSSNSPALPEFLGLFPPLVDESDKSECWLSNAELTFHYTNATCPSLSSSDHSVTTLKVAIPQQGLAQPYLMRMVLALSSFHLAYLNPEKRQYYLLLASKHQELAIKGMRRTLAKSVTAKNCHALWASSVFLVVNKFASFGSCARCQDLCGCSADSALNTLVDIFSMIGGMAAIMRSSREAIQTGPLQTLFKDYAGSQQPEIDLQPLLQKVYDLRNQLEFESLGSDTRLVLVTALERVIDCITDMSNLPNISAPLEVRVLFHWPSRIPGTFLDLARAGHPLAVVIIAYYCCLIRWSRAMYWFFQGWGHPLADCILAAVEGSHWAHLAEWPVGVILSQDG
ncbi:hypothetical protein NM208_g6726 [Fusarium decemcellulare]|uniref:Uncharacterized protein n=1 Tax=Fusarium decemcellulare TaxID=57161 RepID=A0ACC1SBY7_9HYPO|nr:hypothetical protein NM208_g6726 [Fusarium decemcellulare]